MSAPLLVPDARLYRAPAAPAPNPEALSGVADLLVNAEWPVIVAGEVGARRKRSFRSGNWPRRSPLQSSMPTGASRSPTFTRSI